MRVQLLAAMGLVSLTIAACSATKIDTQHMSSADLVTAPQYMGIYPVVPNNVKVIGPVSAQLCQAKLTDRAPTGDEVLAALKVEAAKAGGTALADVSYGADAKQTAHCYSTAHATGVAYVHG